MHLEFKLEAFKFKFKFIKNLQSDTKTRLTRK